MPGRKPLYTTKTPGLKSQHCAPTALEEGRRISSMGSLILNLVRREGIP